MFDLPEKTKIKKIIYKNTIYQRFPKELSGKKKERFDQDISRITITNELSEKSINMTKTKEVPAIFVVKIDLKTKEYLDSNIILISKLFGQKLLLILSYKNEYRLAIYETNLLVSDWKKEDEIHINLNGLNLKAVWENLVIQVGNFTLEKDNNLKEQIEIENEKNRLMKLINITENKARKEKQSKKKFKLFKELNQYKKQLEDL